jgi:biopolymer transport protein ExbB/TolQ
MELLQNPIVIIFILGSALTFTIWLLRLEGVIKTMERDLLKLEKKFDEHERDEAIHQDEKSLIEFKAQFEKRLEHLTRAVEKSNDEVKVSPKEMSAKLDRLPVKRNQPPC